MHFLEACVDLVSPANYMRSLSASSQMSLNGGSDRNIVTSQKFDKGEHLFLISIHGKSMPTINAVKSCLDDRGLGGKSIARE